MTENNDIFVAVISRYFSFRYKLNVHNQRECLNDEEQLPLNSTISEGKETEAIATAEHFKIPRKWRQLGIHLPVPLSLLLVWVT